MLVFGLPLAVFLIGLRYVGSGDTEPAELLPISLLTEGNLDFNEFVSSGDLPYPYRRVGERIVSSYPIVAGLLNVPVYAAARAFGVDLHARRFELSMMTASLMTALSVLFLYLALLRICESPRQALACALVYAFGTCAWSVASRGLWQHTPSLLFLSAALWLLLEPDYRRVALAGLMLGLAVASRQARCRARRAGIGRYVAGWLSRDPGTSRLLAGRPRRRRRVPRPAGLCPPPRTDPLPLGQLTAGGVPSGRAYNRDSLEYS